MSFSTDKQTLDDLNIPGKYKPGSVFTLFNKVQTSGGERLLEYMFHNPLTNVNEINDRRAVFQYFEQKALTFPFDRQSFEVMENYLGAGCNSNLMAAGINNLRKKILGAIVRDEAYNILQTGLQATIYVLNAFYDFLNSLKGADGSNPYQEQRLTAESILADKRLGWLKAGQGGKKLTVLKVTRYDYLLRSVLSGEMETLLNLIYQLDVYIAVSDVSRLHGFSYAQALPADRNVLSATSLRHPRLEKAVGNTVSISRDSNVLFLTGANMAGKSTFMKSFGIAVYLAHMGFPVAANDMVFSVKDGLCSSINVPDNLNMGYSHFYAEVLRVKKVAEEVSREKNLVVIFDELFKGTNVKDAYEGTMAITKAFSEYRNCFFIISTHIIEVGEILQPACDNLQFAFLPTIMEGGKPRYSYKLQQGITNDRMGMIIIEQEGILDMMRQEIKRK